MRYIYCPQCGRKLIERPAGDEGLVPYCEGCEKLWFDTFPSCSIVLAANEYDEIALLRQDYMSDKYTTFVSGYITPGENAEQTAVREVAEEIGIKVEKLDYAGTYWFEKQGLLMHGFITRVKKQPLVLSSEVNWADWVPAEKVIDTIFPDSPGNAAFAIYMKFMDEYFGGKK